jgi:hypothetical protein
MYEKPVLTFVGSAATIVLGPSGTQDDSESFDLQPLAGLVQGLDD